MRSSLASPSLFPPRRQRAMRLLWRSTASSRRPSIVAVGASTSTRCQVPTSLLAGGNSYTETEIFRCRGVGVGRGGGASMRKHLASHFVPTAREVSGTLSQLVGTQATDGASTGGYNITSISNVAPLSAPLRRSSHLPISERVLGNKFIFGFGQQPQVLSARLYTQSSRRCNKQASETKISNTKGDPTSSSVGGENGYSTDAKETSIPQQLSALQLQSPIENEKVEQAKKNDSKEQFTTKPSEQSIHNISYLPDSLVPYAHLARLDKPIGTFLLLHPCLWSTALACVPLEGSATTLTDTLSLCALFGLGSFIMRGAGCTINDMWDSQYDKNVERTRSRPLASGALTYPQAWKFLALQLSAGLGVLLSLPHLEQCFAWGVASLPLVATYPLMKRYTNYPQLVLGLTFNWGAIMGWVAVHGEVDWSVVGPLYASGVTWTLVYDTLYAHQDKRDDAKLGLKSTALTFGEVYTKPILAGLSGVTWGGWMMAGYNCGMGAVLDAPYYYVGVSAAASHLLWQIYTADLNDADNLAHRFRSNNLVGWIVFGSCVSGSVMLAA